MVELTDLELLEIDGGDCNIFEIRDCEPTPPPCIHVGDGNYLCPL